MDLRPRSTRVKAPDCTPISLASGAASSKASMKPATQSLAKDGGRLMKTPPARGPPFSHDLRKPLRIATWNVLTLANPGYPEALVSELRKYRILMAGLTEVRLTDSGARLVDGCTLLHSGGPTRSNGVALLLDKMLAKSLVTWNPISDRLLCARLKHKHGYMSVVVAYAPTDSSPDSSKDDFYHQLESLTTTFPPHDKVIVLGDFNAVSGTDRQGYEDVVGNYGAGTVNDNSTRFLSYCCAHRLSIMGSWFCRRDMHRFTWYCNDGRTRKEIDHILTSDRSLFKAVRVYRGAEPPAISDHRLLIATIALNPYRAPRQRASVGLDVALLAKDASLEHSYNVEVSNAFAALGNLSQDVECAWEQVRATIINTAKKIVPPKRSQRRSWLTPGTMEVIDQKREARLHGQRDEYRKLKGVYKARAKADLESYYCAIADEAEEGFRRNDLRPAFHAIRRLNGKSHINAISVTSLQYSDGSPCKTADEITRRWIEHYEAALNHSPASSCPDLDNCATAALPDSTISEDVPTLNEVKSAIRRLRNGKAAGPDEITPELLKYAEAPISRALHELFTAVWATGKVPAEWKDGIIVSLYKGKGCRSSCSNYRPISLLSVPGKVFAHVLLARLQPLADKTRRPQQSGFTKGRSTIEAILALRLLSQLHRAFNRPLQVAYIDMKAAFDSVDREALWKTMQGAGTPPFLLQLLRDLHTGTTARVRTADGLSRPFHTSSGVRQGCVLAPFLFCRAMDWLMERLSANFGIQIGDSLISDIDYADDVVLFNADASWAPILVSYEASANCLGMHCNWQKTKLQNVGVGSTPPTVQVDGHIVDPVTKFTYLGSDITSDGFATAELHRRVGFASSILGQLDGVWSHSRLSLNTKLRLYTSLVQSVLLYGSETWTLSQDEMKRLQAFHMKAQRRILQIKWHDFVSNDSVRTKTKLPDLDHILADRRHMLLGHVRRLSDDTPAHIALRHSVNAAQGRPPTSDWKRPPGRPRKTWIQQVTADEGLDADALWSCAEDRVVWRSLRPSLVKRSSE